MFINVHFDSEIYENFGFPKDKDVSYIKCTILGWEYELNANEPIYIIYDILRKKNTTNTYATTKVTKKINATKKYIKKKSANISVNIHPPHPYSTS